MTAYEIDNLPQDFHVAPLAPELMPEGVEMIRGLLDSPHILAGEIRAGHVFDRKGYMNFTAFGDEPNRSYQSDSDDVIVQLTLRIDGPLRPNVPEIQAIIHLEEAATEHRIEAERARLESEIEAAEKAVETARANAERKREALAKLTNRK